MQTPINTLPRISNTHSLIGVLIGLLIIATMIGCSYGSPPEMMKRKAPPKVLPITAAGHRYEVDRTKPGTLKVTNLGSGAVRTVEVFKQSINPTIERDIQIRFISSMKAVKDMIVVGVEDGRIFEVSTFNDTVAERKNQ